MPEPIRVLVVEDDVTIARLLVDSLLDEGHEVRQAGEGGKALDLLARWLPDVILLDLMMPGMDGWAFRDHQREQPSPIADVPVVVVTAARQSREQSDRLGAAAIVRKPFDLDDVLRTVADVAQAHQHGKH